jgi:hypothetical protein
MSFSPTPPPHPSDAGQATTSQEEMSASTHPAGAAPSIPAQGMPRPLRQTAPNPKQPQEEQKQGCRKEPREMFPVPQLSPPLFHVNVWRQGADPFVRGVVIGAIATVIGFLIGLFYFLLST